MDLSTVTDYRFARTREDLALAPGERFLGGGTWLFSEPQTSVTGLVDLSTLGWPAWEVTGGADGADEALTIAATCTIAELSRLPRDPGWRPEWRAAPLFTQCPDALLASFKIWNLATVGGNIVRSYAAAAMVALAAALDAEALLWTPDGGERRAPVAGLVTGNGTNNLEPGEVLRSVTIGGAALRARTAFRKIALAELGRSGAVVTGRQEESGAVVVGITAATSRPEVLRYTALPTSEALAADVEALTTYYTDPLGSADWRRGVTGVLAEEIRQELAA